MTHDQWEKRRTELYEARKLVCENWKNTARGSTHESRANEYCYNKNPACIAIGKLIAELDAEYERTKEAEKKPFELTLEEAIATYLFNTDGLELYLIARNKIIAAHESVKKRFEEWEKSNAK